LNVKSEFESTRTEKVAAAISNNKKYLIVAGIALIAVLAAIGALEYMNRQKADKSVLAAEQIDEKLMDYMTAADEDKAALKEDLTGLIDSAKSDYAHLYAHLRALDAESQILADEEEWGKAADSFLAIADEFPKSYMASVSLLNASAMMEQNGDAQGALAPLERVVNDYKTVSPDVPEALFSLGRLNEGLGQSDKALEYYGRIGDEYSSSSWNNLAKSRIIAIKAGN